MTELRLADLFRLPVQERHEALRSLSRRDGASRMLRADLRAATNLGQGSAESEQSMAAGWRDRVLARVQTEEAALDSEASSAQELFEKLLELPANRAETLVRNSRKHHTWSLCQLLKRESHQILFRDPQRGAPLARLALEIAEGSLMRAPSDALVNDLRGSCYTFLANAHRAVGEFAEAEIAFKQAQQHLRIGTGDPLESAKLAEWKGILRLKQRRFDEAEKLFDRAIKTYLSVDDRHAAGSVLISKAVMASDAGEPQESIRLNKRALELIDVAKDQRLQNIARHNLALDLKELGAYDAAMEEIRALKVAHARQGDTISILRMRNLEGEIAFALGEHSKALEIKHEVRDAFAANGLTFDVAGVTLDLASYYLQLNQLAETKRLAAESLPIFRALGVHREAITAFLFFQEAAEREAATVELVREIATYIRASRTNPELKFRS